MSSIQAYSFMVFLSLTSGNKPRFCIESFLNKNANKNVKLTLNVSEHEKHFIQISTILIDTNNSELQFESFSIILKKRTLVPPSLFLFCVCMCVNR